MRASISRVKCFKACPRAYYFKYVEGLKSTTPAESLETGKAYHARLEALEKGEPLPNDFTKDCAMAKAYEKYIFPKFKVIAAEQEFEKKLGRHTLHGFVDGMTEDGFIVEHKTTSGDISEGGEYEYNLLWDEQVLAYMSLTGKRKVYYTVVRKPTIRLKQNETDEEFFNRMVAWYDEDTEHKIRVFIVERTDEEVKQFEKDFKAICKVMKNTENLYRNTCHCNAWGRRCEYSSICLNYDPKMTYVEFEKEERNEC